MEPPKPASTTFPARANALSLAVHEVNNPLDSLLNLLYLVEGEPNLSKEGRKHLRMAREEVIRISHIARHAMKGFQRRESAIEPDLNDVLGSVLDQFEPRFHSQDIAVDNSSHGDGRFMVRPEQIRQVLSNLILNAIDAMPSGGLLCARASKRRVWSGAGREGLRVTIGDNGTGILPENLSRIREFFFTTKGFDGNGMGLAVLQEIVEQHYSGVMRVRSSSVKAGKSVERYCRFFLPIWKDAA